MKTKPIYFDPTFVPKNLWKNLTHSERVIIDLKKIDKGSKLKVELLVTTNSRSAFVQPIGFHMPLKEWLEFSRKVK